MCIPTGFIFSQALFPSFVDQADVALDVCTPTSVTMVLYTVRPTFQQQDSWGEPLRCSSNPRLVTVQLNMGQCVPVVITAPPGTNSFTPVSVNYWRLRSTDCDPPGPVLTLRQTSILSCSPPNNFFNDVFVVNGACSVNSSGPFLPGSPPLVSMQSFLTYTGATPNTLSIDVFNNNYLPGGTQTFAGCGNAQSPHFMYTLANVPIGPAVSDTCTNFPTANRFEPGTQRGFRLFPATTYPTSRTAPAAPPDAATALAAGLTGIIIGSVGIAFAIVSCCAMGVMYYRLTSLLNANAAPRAVTEWASKTINPAAAAGINSA
jgi:hypothetical protein